MQALLLGLLGFITLGVGITGIAAGLAMAHSAYKN
ncbi:MAG: hypothetical protein JWQ64_1893 [Subtercola sp.]|jgi:hypothetical protein|nr:hypothetical protein [Subtercola sp.]